MRRLEATNMCMLAYTDYAADSRVRREAEALRYAGYHVDVVCLRRQGESPAETLDGVRLFHVPLARYRGNGFMLYLRGYGLFVLLAALRLLLLMPRRRYAVIHIHTPPDFLLFAAVIFKLVGTRLILDMHDHMPELYLSRFGGSRRSVPFKLLVVQERWSARVADRILVVHHRQRDLLARRGIPASKMTVLMNCADERLFARQRYSDTDNSEKRGHFVVLYHGTLLQRYGLETLARAVANVSPDLPELRVSVVGDGDFRTPLEQLIRRLGIERVITVIPAVAYPEIPSHIMAADACVVPIHRDMFTDDILPVKLLEAVAMECPVIAARTPTIEQYFSDEAVCFFRAGDAGDLARCLRHLARDAEYRRRLAARAALESRPYRWTESRAVYYALMQELTSRAIPRSASPGREEALPS